MGNKLIEHIKKDKSCIVLRGVSGEAITEAEDTLALKFSDEYRAMLKEYGTILVSNHEIIGLGSSKRLDVVYNTLTERSISKDFPSDQYVIEETGMDGIVITQDKTGTIYQYLQDSPLIKVADSLLEYLYKAN